MNSKVYKWCAVPHCKNTSIATPKKLFVYVPNKKIVRDKWLKLAWRDPAGVVTNSPIYFCEDHFDLPNDMENYMQYHVMGSVSQVRMKPGCIPKKFACQPDRKSRTSDTLERLYISKKRKVMAPEECENQLEENIMVTENVDIKEIASGSSVQHNPIEAQQGTSKMIDKSVQTQMTKKFRSKANQTDIKSVNQMTSSMKTHLHSVSTSPFEIVNISSNQSIPSVSVVRKLVLKKEHSDSDISYTPSVTHIESSPSTKSFQMESVSDSSEIKHIDQVIRRLREFNMLKPHTCVNLNMVKVLDDEITVAYGLIDLQDSLIK